MGITVAEADELLHQAFPWGVVVVVDTGESAMTIGYAATDDVPYGPDVDPDVDTVVLAFELVDRYSNPSVTRAALEQATETGRLTFLGGGYARQPEIEDLVGLVDPVRDFIGPQSKGETGWIRRMRLHQSWWRTFRLRRPFGTGPKKSSKGFYGNMLDEAGDEAGLNFLTDEAREAYKERYALTKEGIEPFRTRRHLMASQPMAFNLFGHLRYHPDLAAGLFDRLLGPGEVDAVTSIEIERLSDALEDHTAFDVFVTYRRPGPDAAPACIAIETKLTEPFSQATYNWDRYLNRKAFDTAVWKTTDTAILGDLRWSQLWRNHLLGEAESARHGLGPVSLLVVHHPEDPGCDTNVTGYRDGCLHDGVPVRAVDIGEIHQILTELTADETQRTWLADFADRYLNLHLSEPLVVHTYP